MENTRRPPFDVTRAAIHKIVTLGGNLRLDLVEGGCCGTTYRFAAADAQPGDERFGCPGAWLSLSTSALAAVEGARLDDSDRVRPRRFRVLRSTAPERCPCHRSFGTPWPGQGHRGCQAYTPMPWDP